MRHTQKSRSSLPGPDNITREVLPNGITLLVRENFVNPSVVIRFTTPGGPTTIDIYDISGRHIRRIFMGRLENGEYRRTWDGLDEKGRKVSSGVYFYRIKSGRHTARGKLVLLR